MTWFLISVELDFTPNMGRWNEVSKNENKIPRINNHSVDESERRNSEPMSRDYFGHNESKRSRRRHRRVQSQELMERGDQNGGLIPSCIASDMDQLHFMAHNAILDDDVDVVKDIFKYKTLEVLDLLGNSPLHVAARGSSYNCLK